MSQTQTVKIGDRHYDPLTGLPVNASADAKIKVTAANHHVTTASHTIHTRAQKSHTLDRRHTKRPIVPVRAGIETTPKPITRNDITRRRTAQDIKPHRTHPSVTRFAPHPKVVVVKPELSEHDQPAMTHKATTLSHPVHHNKPVHLHQHIQHSADPKPAKDIKNEAIEQAMAQTLSRKEADKLHAHKPKRQPRALSIASAAFALLLLGGYFTYLNMPSLSVRVAAAQAGIDASYPEYRPDGYRLNGPVAFSDGQVKLSYAANGGPQNFTITQQKSAWNSVAVLDNYVKDKAGESYMTYSDRGLTIYTFGGNAAWVTGGILYTVDGDAPLSGDQIRRIAGSL